MICFVVLDNFSHTNLFRNLGSSTYDIAATSALVHLKYLKILYRIHIRICNVIGCDLLSRFQSCSSHRKVHSSVNSNYSLPEQTWSIYMYWTNVINLYMVDRLDQFICAGETFYWTIIVGSSASLVFRRRFIIISVIHYGI